MLAVAYVHHINQCLKWAYFGQTSLLLIEVSILIDPDLHFTLLFYIVVRCTVMESFSGIEWRRYKTCTQSMSQTFVLGPFVEALNDSVHHKDFGRCFLEKCNPMSLINFIGTLIVHYLTVVLLK